MRIPSTVAIGALLAVVGVIGLTFVFPNFMATNGRGLICVPLLQNRCDELNLDLILRPEQLSCEMYYKITAKYEKLFG